MSRRFLNLRVVAALGLTPLAAVSAEPPLTQEVHELRRDLQLQTKKIEALTQQIAQLSRIIQERDAVRPTPEPAATTSVVAAAAKPTAPAPEPAIPKAEPEPPSSKHVVEKGETLTSIAKHYNIPLADLLKRNKNTNDRKLQIGQTILVPAAKTAPAAPAETTAEKKETP